MNETLENFFLYLAERVSHENRVSDVLYAAMNASPETFRIVADAVGLPEEANIENTEIRREVTFRIEKGTTQGELARPDFLLLPHPGTPVLIEVKLFDTDYHRDKYERVRVDGKPPSLVLLTAREPLEDLRSHGWTIVLWDKIIKALEAKGRTNPFLSALARYLREVTGMMNIEAVNFGKDGPKAMLYLNRLIKKVIQTYPDDDTGARTEVDFRSKGCMPEYSGHYYTLKINQSKGAQIAFYFGVVYDDKKAGLQLWIKLGVNSQQVTDALRNHYGGKLQTGEHGHFVMLDDKKYHKIFFADEPDKDAQERVLKEFFTEFNSIVAQSL